MSASTPDDVEQDFIDVIFKAGQIAGTLSKHRKTHPHRVHMVRQMMLATMPPDVVEQFYRHHLAPTKTP